MLHAEGKSALAAHNRFLHKSISQANNHQSAIVMMQHHNAQGKREKNNSSRNNIY